MQRLIGAAASHRRDELPPATDTQLAMPSKILSPAYMLSVQAGGIMQGPQSKQDGRRRLAAAVFGAILVVIVAIFAIVQGIGEPSVPAGDVALVEHVADGNVSEAQLKLALLQQAVGAGMKKAPARGEAKFQELRDKALEELLNAIWLRGQGEEAGIEITPKQIASELEQIKSQNFKTGAEFKKFLKTSHLTKKDVNERVRLQIYTTQIQDQITKSAPQPSKSEVGDYYEGAKATQFTTKPSRDVRIITNKDKAKVEAAKAALEKAATDANWKKVAQKYSSDPTTKANGGLQRGLTEELLATAGPLKKTIFESAAKQLVGPIKYQQNYVVLEVVKVTPEKVQPLEEVRSQISSQLLQQRQQQVFSEFVASWQGKWRSRTFCADGYVVERCSNYKSAGRPAGANPACYEANPKAPAKECPAPVQSIMPAAPGSVSILTPQGQRLAQRPRPEGLGEAGEAGAALPEGVAPPIGG